MIPLTPTPIPPGSMPIDASQLQLDGVGLWDLAPEVVGFWNQFAPDNQILQWVAVGILVVLLIFALIYLMKQFGQDDQLE